MSEMQRQLEQALGELTATGASVTADLRPGPDFVGFGGHFPGDPVLPGICMIQAAMLLHARHVERTVRLREVLAAKFREPARPGDALILTVETQAATPAGATIKGTFRHADTTIATVRLEVAYVVR